MGFKKKREEMVRIIRERYGLNAPEVLDIMMKVPREEFVPKKYQGIAYDDSPVDIGHGQTMSQPYTVAEMTRLVTEFPNSSPSQKALRAGGKYQIPNKPPSFAKASVGKQTPNSKLQEITKSRVLEVGTGSGYQAAILSYFFNEVYTIELIPQLAKKAKRILEKLRYKNVFVKLGSGEQGWKNNAPFDAIMITAGVEKVPKELFKQLKVGGVLVAPVGKGRGKTMVRYTKIKKLRNEELKKEEFGTFHFVPFVRRGRIKT